MCSSFSRSPSSILSTGTPVQRETTPATWSGVTASSIMPPPSAFASTSVELLLQSRNDAVGELARLGPIALALRGGELVAGLLELLLEIGRGAELVLLGLPARGDGSRTAPRDPPAPSRAARGGPWRRYRSPSSGPPARSCRRTISRSMLSSSSGFESTCMRRREDASSTRSIALSGRKRSVM